MCCLIFPGKAKLIEGRKDNSLELVVVAMTGRTICTVDEIIEIIENNNKFDGDIFMRSSGYNTFKI